MGDYIIPNDEMEDDAFLPDKSEVVDLSMRGMPICDGERALPGRGTAFLEKPWEKHQGFHPWTPNTKPEAVCSGSFNW